MFHWHRRFKIERLTCVSVEVKHIAACTVLYFCDAEGKTFRESFGDGHSGMVRRALGLDRREDLANGRGVDVIGHFNLNGALTRLERVEDGDA